MGWEINPAPFFCCFGAILYWKGKCRAEFLALNVVNYEGCHEFVSDGVEINDVWTSLYKFSGDSDQEDNYEDVFMVFGVLVIAIYCACWGVSSRVRLLYHYRCNTGIY